MHSKKGSTIDTKMIWDFSQVQVLEFKNLVSSLDDLVLPIQQNLDYHINPFSTAERPPADVVRLFEKHPDADFVEYDGFHWKKQTLGIDSNSFWFYITKDGKQEYIEPSEKVQTAFCFLKKTGEERTLHLKDGKLVHHPQKNPILSKLPINIPVNWPFSLDYNDKGIQQVVKAAKANGGKITVGLYLDDHTTYQKWILNGAKVIKETLAPYLTTLESFKGQVVEPRVLQPDFNESQRGQNNRYIYRIFIPEIHEGYCIHFEDKKFTETDVRTLGIELALCYPSRSPSPIDTKATIGILTYREVLPLQKELPAKQ